jgi:phosphoribosylaminoimidazolecarboxamide formyltransferase / IMP cyclohydrolase
VARPLTPDAAADSGPAADPVSTAEIAPEPVDDRVPNGTPEPADDEALELAPAGAEVPAPAEAEPARPTAVAVGVSGAGSNLRALAAAIDRGEVPVRIALVFADRDCPALAWAAEAGLDTALVPAARKGDAKGRAREDATLADALAGSGATIVVLAGYMRVLQGPVVEAFAGRILNVHPSLLPAFPGAHAVRDALDAGARVTGVTVHLVDESLDGGPIVLAEAVEIGAGESEDDLLARVHAVEHRLLPRAVALLAVDALRVDGRTVVIDAARAASAVPAPRRALLSVSDKAGLVPFAGGLVALGWELVSTGGTAGAIRDAGLPVTDVSAVTGFPEMLDGRVKTLHPRVHAGILADRRLASHREQLAAAAIAPFDLVVVNLYPFAAAAAKPGLALDELVEEIDIGGPSMVRAAAKNHASVAIVTSPARYDAILEALRAHGSVPASMRSALAVEAFRHTASYDALIAEVLPGRMAGSGVRLPDEPGFPGASDPFPPTLVVGLEKVETLRYGENPHQPAARYRRPGDGPATGPFAGGAPSLQGKQLSYNNVLDTAAAAALGRSLRGPACVIVKHTNPCGAAERGALLAAWRDALAGDPVSAFGGVVALTREVTEDVAQALASIFLEIVIAPAFSTSAREILATKPSLRLVLDERLDDRVAVSSPTRPPLPTDAFRTAGGAVLVTAPDTVPDDPDTWTVATRRAPSVDEQRDLELAWRLVRGVTSNAIVLVRGGMLVGIGSGQTSRVDAARQAVEKARSILGPEAVAGASCASDAFFPFPDAVEVCLLAGVRAFVQPGGSMRDVEAVAAADAAGAAMVMTGVRHFRH